MPRLRQRLVRVVLAVALGILVGIGVDVVRAGGPRLWLARHGLPPPYVPAGERIGVGDGSFYLDCRGEGSPTLVLESGAGTGAASWSPVWDELAGTTRTCAYDRAGIGSSDQRGTRTLGTAAAELRHLLELAGERPPFVVVGHSLGGAYARVFASVFRDAVPAIVMIDTFDPDLQTDHIHPLLGPLRPEYEAGLQGLRDTVAEWEDLDWEASEQELRASSVRGRRVAVLVAERYEPRLDAATNARIRETWREAYETLSPGMTTYEYAPGAGHIIPWDRPDLVVELVRRVMREVRDGR